MDRGRCAPLSGGIDPTAGASERPSAPDPVAIGVEAVS